MAEKHLTKARECVQKKNYEYAVHWFLTHLKAEPGDLSARKEMRQAERAWSKMQGSGMGRKIKAKLLEGKASAVRIGKDPEKAILACEDILKQDCEILTAYLKLGEAASHANLNELAVMAFEDALTVDKKSKDAWRLMGRVYRNTEQLKQALKCFQHLQKLEPKDKEAMDACKNIPAQMTSQNLDGKNYTELVDKDEAKKLERQQGRIRTPEQALARISDLEVQLRDDPYDTKTMTAIAKLYMKAEQPDEALKMAEKALKIDAENYEIAEFRGDLLLERNATLVKKYEQAVKKDPSLKSKLERAKKQKLDYEIEEYRRRVEAHPTEYGLRYQLGKALYDSGNIDEAIPELQSAKQDPRKKSDAGYWLGRCYVSKKIYKLAVKEFEVAREELFEMEGLKKEITYMLGRIYEQAKKTDKAIAEYEAIATKDFNYRDVTKRLEALSSF
jgi:tetratricopeptide (TPR) repeat protein